MTIFHLLVHSAVCSIQVQNSEAAAWNSSYASLYSPIGRLLLPSWVHQQGAGFKVEQWGLKPERMQDASSAGLIPSITTQDPIHTTCNLLPPNIFKSNIRLVSKSVVHCRHVGVRQPLAIMQLARQVELLFKTFQWINLTCLVSSRDQLPSQTNYAVLNKCSCRFKKW